jgi:hypothetical protein
MNMFNSERKSAMKLTGIVDVIGYVGLRGFVAGTTLGAAYGLISFTLYGLFYGALFGAVIGFVAGTFVGLLVILIIRAVLQPVHDVARFRIIVTLLCALLTLLGVAFAFSVLWSNDPGDVIRSPLPALMRAFSQESIVMVGLPALIAALYAAYAGRRFAAHYLKSSGVFLPEENEHVHHLPSLEKGDSQ